MSKSKRNLNEAVEQIAEEAENLGNKAATAIKEGLKIKESLTATFTELRSNPSERRQVQEELTALVQSQKDFFAQGETAAPEWRINQLKKLYDSLKRHEEDIYTALHDDLLKSPFESYTSEIGLIFSEITNQIKHLKKWSKPKKISLGIVSFPAKGRIYPQPRGTVLIMSPWNYPIQLSLCPLIAAIAAGNTVVLKTSEYSTASTRVLSQILSDSFDPNFVALVEGGYQQNQALLHIQFDFIFFTGSQNVGKIVMESAAKFLTPVCLELGGKSPCIIEADANIKIAARRIVWGKLLNAGQTCVAPDYFLVSSSIKEPLLVAIQEEIKKQYGENPLENEDFPKIINKKHFNRLIAMAPEAVNNVESNKIAPTIIDLGNLGSEKVNRHPSMKEEIFGPLFPIISYENIDEALNFIRSKQCPLALYIFTENKDTASKVINSVKYGGGCVNDVVMHLVSHNLPFGGCGESGMGSYHGKAGFDTFTHYKSVLVQKAKFDTNVRFAPHENKLKLIKMFLK